MISMTSVRLDDESIQAVAEVLKTGQIAQGPKVEEFEKAFARYIGTKYAVAVNSGAAALPVALMAAGIGQGDEVITTSFSFIATANCCLFVGAKPVFADIDEKTFNISVESIEKKITSKTKGIIIVDLCGQPCDMEAVVALCKKHKVGSFGIGCFSFYPTKNMTTGEGGMITTNDEGISVKSKLARQHGQSQRYVHSTLGYNYRMTDIAGAIGICQLKKLDVANSKRMRNASYLTESIRHIDGLIPPHTAPDRNHVFHQYTIKITPSYRHSREKLQAKLLEKGVCTIIYYPTPIHRQQFYMDLGYNDLLPVTDLVSREVLSLPVHPGVTEADLETIVKAIKES